MSIQQLSLEAALGGKGGSKKRSIITEVMFTDNDPITSHMATGIF